MKLKNLEIKLTNIKGLTENKTLVIPSFFPLYAWENKQINELFVDLNNSFKEGSDYFMGGLLSTNFDENNFYIFEGINRLTTILHILKEFSNLENINQNTKKEINNVCFNQDIERLLIETNSGELKPPLIPNSTKKHIKDIITQHYGKWSAEELEAFIIFHIHNNFFIFRNIDSLNQENKTETFIGVLNIHKQLNSRGKKFNVEEINDIINTLKNK